MKRSEHRILTTHVGSLIRPKALLDAARDPDPAHRGAHEQELERAVRRMLRFEPPQLGRQQPIVAHSA
jgi:hypothetical protein